MDKGIILLVAISVVTFALIAICIAKFLKPPFKEFEDVENKTNKNG